MWSEVMEADAFGAFEEPAISSIRRWQDGWDDIILVGSVDPEAAVCRFSRPPKPEPQALLRRRRARRRDTRGA